MTQSRNLKRNFVNFIFIASLILTPVLMISAYEAKDPQDGTIPCNSNNPRECEINRPSSGGGGGGNSGSNPPPYQPPKQEDPQVVATDSVVVYVQDSPIEPTGNISANKSNCIIEDDKNDCNVLFDWNVINPKGESLVTRNPEAGFLVQRSNFGEKVSLPVYYGISRYSLYNDGKELDQTSVTASCSSNSSWVESLSKCVKNVSVNKFSTSNCIIPEGGSSCNANISWEVSGGAGSFAVTTPNNITVASGKSGNATYGVEYPSRNFYLYNNGNELAKSTSYADCVEGTAWSVGEKKCVSVLPPEPPIIEPACPPGTTWDELQKKCVTMGHDCPLGTTWSETQKACLCDNGATNPPTCNQGLLSFDVKDCIIKPNESTCQTKLNWASTLSGSFGITTPEQITVSAASSGTDVPYTVEYPSRKFFAYNNGNLVEEKVAYAKCEEGNIWSMTDNKCVSGMLCAGELERDIYFDCPVGYEGKIIRKQFKTFPGCLFEEPATEENTVLVNNNCRSKDVSDPRWTGRSCNECGEGVEQVYCTETNENGDVREFIMNCPGDVGGGGSGQSVLNIEIKATPEKIMKGRLSTITWSSNADSCRAIPVPGYLNDFNTGEGNRPNGFDTVKPLSNNLYKIECTKGEITESKMIEVKVSSLNIIEL